MDDIEKLASYFKEFPGVGPRQAKRFVYFLLRKNSTYTQEIATLIPKVKAGIKMCDMCQRYFPITNQQSLCTICSSQNREPNILTLVAHDSDLEALEKSGSYNGHYFVLGGLIPTLAEQPEKIIRTDALLKNIKLRQDQGLEEIIIATSVNPDGENTARFVTQLIQQHFPEIKISQLGRGLSTGSELEYADSETLRSALENRK